MSMVSKYDVFYVILTKGELRVTDIVAALHRNKNEYNNITQMCVLVFTKQNKQN